MKPAAASTRVGDPGEPAGVERERGEAVGDSGREVGTRSDSRTSSARIQEYAAR
jgi:hypothetical protein